MPHARYASSQTKRWRRRETSKEQPNLINRKTINECDTGARESQSRREARWYDFRVHSALAYCCAVLIVCDGKRNRFTCISTTDCSLDDAFLSSHVAPNARGNVVFGERLHWNDGDDWKRMYRGISSGGTFWLLLFIIEREFRQKNGKSFLIKIQRSYREKSARHYGVLRPKLWMKIKMFGFEFALVCKTALFVGRCELLYFPSSHHH